MFKCHALCYNFADMLFSLLLVSDVNMRYLYSQQVISAKHVERKTSDKSLSFKTFTIVCYHLFFIWFSTRVQSILQITFFGSKHFL